MKQLLLSMLVASTAMVGAANAFTATLTNHTQGLVEYHYIDKDTGNELGGTLYPGTSDADIHTDKLRDHIVYVGYGWNQQGEEWIADGNSHYTINYWQQAPGYFVRTIDKEIIR